MAERRLPTSPRNSPRESPPKRSKCGTIDAFWAKVYLHFYSKDTCDAFFSYVGTLPFTHSVTKVLGQNSLIVRVMIPYEESDNFLEFLNGLSRQGFVASFSSLRILMPNRQTQAILPEEFQDGAWQFNPVSYLHKAKALLHQPADWPRATKP